MDKNKHLDKRKRKKFQEKTWESFILTKNYLTNNQCPKMYTEAVYQMVG